MAQLNKKTLQTCSLSIIYTGTINVELSWFLTHWIQFNDVVLRICNKRRCRLLRCYLTDYCSKDAVPNPDGQAPTLHENSLVVWLQVSCSYLRLVTSLPFSPSGGAVTPSIRTAPTDRENENEDGMSILCAFWGSFLQTLRVYYHYNFEPSRAWKCNDRIRLEFSEKASWYWSAFVRCYFYAARWLCIFVWRNLHFQTHFLTTLLPFSSHVLTSSNPQEGFLAARSYETSNGWSGEWWHAAPGLWNY